MTRTKCKRERLVGNEVRAVIASHCAEGMETLTFVSEKEGGVLLKVSAKE